MSPSSRGALRPHRRRVQIVFQDPTARSIRAARSAQSIVEGPMNFGMPQAEAMERARELMRAGRPRRRARSTASRTSSRAASASASASPARWRWSRRSADGRRGGLGARRLGAGAGAASCSTTCASGFDLAMLFITHDLRVAAQICDRIAVMQHGGVVEEGAPRRSSPRRSTTTPARCSRRRPAARFRARRAYGPLRRTPEA